MYSKNTIAHTLLFAIILVLSYGFSSFDYTNFYKKPKNNIQQIVISISNDTSICIGDSITLTVSVDSLAGNYSWSTGATGSSIVVSPLDTTTFYATFSDSTGSTTDSTTVYIIPELALIPIPDTVITFGDSLTYTVSGTFPPSAVILWSPSNDSTQTIEITPDSSITYIYSVSSICETVFDTFNITVGYPPILMAPQDTCLPIGDSLVLSALGTELSFGSYLWSNSNMILSTDSSFTFLPVQSDSIQLTITTEFGTDSVKFYVNSTIGDNLLTVTDTSLCIGDSIELVIPSNNFGGGSILWSEGTIGDTLIVHPIDTTVLLVELNNTCGSFIDSVSFIVNFPPEIYPTPDQNITAGDTLVLEVSGHHLDSSEFFWLPEGDTTQSITITPDSTKTYIVEATNQCGSVFDSIIVQVGYPPILLSINDTCISIDSIQLIAQGVELDLATYSWSANGQLIGTDSSFIYHTSTTDSIRLIASTFYGSDTIDFLLWHNKGFDLISYSDSTICEGDSILLSISSEEHGGGIAQWSNGMFGDSIMVSPNDSTLYIVSLNNLCGTIVDSVSILLDFNPVLQPILDTTITFGDTVTLNASGSFLDNYLWIPGDSTTASISINPDSTTLYILSSGDNCTTVYDSILVTVGYPPVLNPIADVCINNSIQLAATGLYLDDAIYFWTSNASPISMDSVFTYFPSSSDTIKLTVHTTHGSDTVSFYLAKGNGPQLNPILDIMSCPGDSVQLTADGLMFESTSYLWSTGQSDTSITVSPIDSTFYSLIATDICGQDSVGLWVLIDPTSINFSSNDTVLTAVASGLHSPFVYSWSNGIDSNAFTIFQTGWYTVSVTDALGCLTIDSFEVNSTAPQYSLDVNPASCNISDGFASISILSGIASPEFLWSDGTTADSVSNLAPGNYTVTISDAATIWTESVSFVIEEDSSCYSVVSGYIYNDNDIQMCISNSLPLQNVLVRLADQYQFTDALGYYEFISAPDSTSLEVYPSAVYVLNCPLTNLVPITIPSGSILSNQNFYLIYQNHQDISISGYSNPAQSDSVLTYHFDYCNHSNFPIDGDVTFKHDSTLLNFTSTPPTSQYDNINFNATWQYTNLMPGECRTIEASFLIPSGSDGVVLEGEAIVNPIWWDDFTVNNTLVLNQTVADSYYAHYKRGYPSTNGITGALEQKDSLINFHFHTQNTTGTIIENVTIRDTLNSHLDMTSISFGSTTHPFIASIESGNVLVVKFKNVNLPDATTNFLASQIMLTFSIKREVPLALGTQIVNSGTIWLDDQSFPTNQVILTRDDFSPIQDTKELSLSTKLYPNPTREYANLEIIAHNNLACTIEVINMLGQKEEVQSLLLNEGQQLISVGHHLKPGLYFVNIRYANQSKTLKLLIE